MTRTRWGVALFFLAYAGAVTWPGAVPFNRIRPLILGMPLSMVWVALWLVLAFVALLLLDRAEDRRDRNVRDRRRPTAGSGPVGSAGSREPDGESPRRDGP